VAERGPVRVLELRTVRGTGGGPEKTILLGAAATDPRRATVTVCYLRDARDEVFHIDERAAALGIDYAEIVERHSFDPGIWQPLKRLVAGRRIDVVHSHDYKTDLLAWLLGRATGAVPMATAHGWTGHSRRERLVYYPAHKRLLARFPLVLAVSSQIREEIVARGADPSRVRVLLNGIDHRAFRRDRSLEAAARDAYGVPPGATAIGAVGRLEPQKRFDLLLEAFDRLRRGRDDLFLLIAGDGSSHEALAAAIRARGLDAACRLAGHVRDVPAFHHALDLFVQSSEYEGTPNVVLEAMALETPIVATDVGGTIEVCRPGLDGLIVAPRDAAALATAVAEALAAPGARADRVQSARRRIETDLSFERRLRTLEDIYESLAQREVAA
jgi:glycosyltransferase involved in cell wall biosynthesis